ncbi:DnaJ protein-like protein [Aureobasidium subglaciale]|nr:DnaJ protein-like protein [Aureobasidium subglaciale]
MLFKLAWLLLCVLPLVALCAEDYYKLLGIEKNASDRELKKAYRTLSKKYHPDKNPGDESVNQKFVEIAEAYEALSEPETRKIYDQYGHEGLKQHKEGGHRQGGNPFDLFSRFFGGGGHFGHASGQRRGPNMEVRVAVPLRDFYNGAEHEIALEKQAICSSCEGSGSEDGKTDTCGKCKGHGMIIQKAQLAPGIFQQMQMQCDLCGGKGTTIQHKCKTCGGSRHVREVETFTVNIEKGMPKGARINYENEGDESPDYVAGDLIVQVVEKDPELGKGEEKHDRTDGTFFRRKGNDLFWREVLSLREAWLGDWTRNLTHLDGHTVQLSRKRGQVIQPNSVEVVKNEGMPIWRHEDGPEYGNLHVEYTVILPDQMDKNMEKDFWNTWDKWRRKSGVDLQKDAGRPAPVAAGSGHDEL